MKLTCSEANEIIKRNEQEMRQLESLLKKMPKEDLRCARNGRNYKWFCIKEGCGATYIPKSDRKFAEKLALKKYYESRYEELSHQVKALKYYERQMKEAPGEAEDLLKHEEWGKLLEPVYSVQREDLKIWMEEEYEGGAGHPEHLVYKGSRGKYLRSKSEVIIDMMLYKYEIPFRYEDKLILDNGICIKLYCDNGIIPSINLIATFETADHSLDVERVEKIIQEYLL